MPFTHTTAMLVQPGGLKLQGTPTPQGPTVILKGTSPLRLPSIYFGGRYKIAGTVKLDDTPDDVPLRRKVMLFAEPAMLVVDTTWSDATTGAYEFIWLSNAYRYSVVAFDYEHDYRAVIADNLTPEAM